MLVEEPPGCLPSEAALNVQGRTTHPLIETRAELETYARELGWIFDQIGAALNGLTAAQLNWRPSTGAANSIYAIASHVAGTKRVYALGFGGGMLVSRYRRVAIASS